MKKFPIVVVLMLATQASAEEWEHFAVTPDGRYLADVDTFRLKGTGVGHDDFSADVKIKNFDTKETFRVAIGLTDCMKQNNGALLLVPSVGEPQVLYWDSQGHELFDLAGIMLCQWAKTQVSLTGKPKPSN